MDVPPPARPVAAAEPDLRGAPASPPPPGHDVSRRLAALETAVADLARRVDALATSSEATVSAAVAREVQGVAGELRHTVSELGRLLVRDLGKLSKILAEHRDTILAEIRGPDTAPPVPGDEQAGAGAPAGASPSAAPGGDGPEPAATAAPEAPPADAADAAEAGTPATEDEDGERSWLRRRRHS